MAGLALWTAACGGADRGAGTGGPAPVEVTSPARYATALRLAALGRIESRGGLDELAAEHFRAAYHQHPDVDFLLAYAKATERARLFAESRDATRLALAHPLTAEQRSRLEGELVRLQSLVPPGLVRVAVLVRPDNARVVLSRDDQTRTLLASGEAWLLPGLWNVETSAKGFQSELRTFQVGADGDRLSIALHSEDAGPAIALEPAPKPAEVARKPEPEPGPKPGPKPEPPLEAKVERKPIPEVEPGAEVPKVKPPEGPTVKYGFQPEAPRQSFLHRYGPFLTAGVGVVAFGVGGYFGYRATLNASTANDLVPTAKSYKADLDFYVDAAESNVERANLLFAAGGTLVSAGVVWWFLAPEPKAPPPPARAPAPAPGKPAAQAGQPTGADLVPDAFAVSPRSIGVGWSF